MAWDIEVRRSLGREWEYAETVETEEDATEFVTGDEIHLSGSAPAVCFRISPRESGGPDEFLYWRDGAWVDPSCV